MLAVLGLVGLAMSSFVILGDRENSDSDGLNPDDRGTDPGQGPDLVTGQHPMLEEIAPGWFQMLSDTDGDAGAGGVLADGEAAADGADDVMVMLSDTDGDAGAGGVLAEESGDDSDVAAVTLAAGAAAGDAADADFGDDLAPDLPPARDRVGTADDDRLDGTPEDEALYGAAGHDAITGNLGDDLLSGEEGDDSLHGGSGHDILSGGLGDDQLEGGWDDDTLTGDTGRDLLNGGGGNDVLDGQDEDDGFDYLNGGAGDDLLLAGAGDHLNGGAGADTFALTATGANRIDDFDPDADTLEVTFSGTPPVLSTAAGDDGLMLLADDAVVAHLAGVTTLDLSRVVLIAA